MDYIGVFRNLQKALAIYGGATGGGGETPIQNKAELVEYLKHLIAEATSSCGQRGIGTSQIKHAQGFEKVALLQDAVEVLIENDETKRGFLGTARAISRVFKAILPDKEASAFAPDVVLFSVIAQKIKSLIPAPDIAAIMGQVEDLLDRSVAPVPYGFPAEPTLIDLSEIDFEKLKEQFETGKRRTEAEKLRALLNQKLMLMVAQNATRADFLERFQKLIDDYNSGSQNIEALFAELVKLAKALTEDEQRAMREGLSEEELALFDILTKPEPELSEKQKGEVKKVCKSLLETLKREKLVLDWRNKPKAKADVRLTIEKTFDQGLPDAYDAGINSAKCEAAYRHIYDAYYGGGASLYAAA